MATVKEPLVVDRATAESRLRALLKSGFGAGLPRREADRWIVLHEVAATLGDDETLDEKAITERIGDWLAENGPRLETDAVTLRRALVDDGFVERDGHGRAYRRSRAHERRVVFRRCVPCSAGEPPLSDEDARALLSGVPGWEIAVVDDVPRLTRSFKFEDFASALAFANRVGAEADREDHHPELVVTWGRVTVGWWTHAIGGLHRNDFVLAARTDRLLASEGGADSGGSADA